MKHLQGLRNEWIKEYEKTLVPNSKFYDQDLQDFTKNVNACKDKMRMAKAIENLKALRSKAFDRFCEKEVSRMEEAGLFNINNFKPINALD